MAEQTPRAPQDHAASPADGSARRGRICAPASVGEQRALDHLESHLAHILEVGPGLDAFGERACPTMSARSRICRIPSASGHSRRSRRRISGRPLISTRGRSDVRERKPLLPRSIEGRYCGIEIFPATLFIAARLRRTSAPLTSTMSPAKAGWFGIAGTGCAAIPDPAGNRPED